MAVFAYSFYVIISKGCCVIRVIDVIFKGMTIVTDKAFVSGQPEKLIMGLDDIKYFTGMQALGGTIVVEEERCRLSIKQASGQQVTGYQ